MVAFQNMFGLARRRLGRLGLGSDTPKRTIALIDSTKAVDCAGKESGVLCDWSKSGKKIMAERVRL